MPQDGLSWNSPQASQVPCEARLRRVAPAFRHGVSALAALHCFHSPPVCAMIRVGTGTLAPLIGGVPRAGFHDNEQMGKYDTLNKEELVRLIEARDRREAIRYGLVWETTEIGRAHV